MQLHALCGDKRTCSTCLSAWAARALTWIPQSRQTGLLSHSRCVSPSKHKPGAQGCLRIPRQPRAQGFGGLGSFGWLSPSAPLYYVVCYATTAKCCSNPASTPLTRNYC